MSDPVAFRRGSFGREHCPTCGAPRRGDAACHRCRSDLSALARIERQVDDLRRRARRCYGRGWYRQAAAIAGEIVTLEGEPEDLRFLVCARLMSGDFPGAVTAYRPARLAEPGP